MATTTFEVDDYDLAVEPWGPIKRRIVLRGPERGHGGRDEATLLFSADQSETGVVYHADDESRGTAAWAYFDVDDYGDVRDVVERGTPPYFHYGHTSGTGTTRTLYFVSVETSANAPGVGGDADGRGGSVERSLPMGAYDPEESMDLAGEESADADAFERIERRNRREE
ncbi:hypothetical protein SAMN04488063_1082 [Halopelagius inordinatus]|uniref:Uncharacterized protein n=1 Tax=Halopelagius inordinatus TaxID=553467 RepID=A0A1I2NEE4_9EURY|nr:hypothetical protein [Halopelagius inordinatus]SFF99886.1 hypothetical protein SAMN04488063_1082 [Halopelagius inordinatus]